VIASGGVSSLADIVVLADVSGVAGVITGKALYEGRFTVAEALQVLRR
jgi:phosphoribosylformimino-5-aminoimidazole carboxamide ribonucleotide (ProFAR) isomerase